MSTPTPAPTGKKMKRVKVTRVVNGVDTEVEMEVEDTGEDETWGPRKEHKLLNTRLTRVDGPQKVTGSAKYTHDIRLPGMLYGRVLRSPHARAKVRSLDLHGALALRGVKAAVKAPTDDLYFEGQAVAAVAAETADLAEDALRAIKVEYDVLPHVTDPAAASKAGAPTVMATGPNLESKEKKGDPAKIEAAWAACDVIVEGDYKTPFIHHCSLETHGHVIDFRGGDSAVVYASTQGVFSVKADAVHALGLPDANVTVICENMGGGFGAKFGIGIEGALAIELSKQAAAPVHLMLTRRDEFSLAGNRSASWQTLKGGATKDGRLVALHAYQRRLGGLAPGSQATQPYVYDFENAYAEVVSIHTNENPSRAMRAPGHPQASFAMEMLVDEIAHRLGMDPVELRKKNLKDPVWHRQLDRGAREIGWARRNPIPGTGAGHLRRGIGCAVGAWGGGGNRECVVTLEVGRDGAVIVKVGSQDLGTGTRTYTRAIVAEELGLTMKDVVERIGDSRLGRANASGGSTTAASLAPAVKDAAFRARLEMAKAVAPLLKAEAAKVVFADGMVVSPDGQKLTWKQACATLPSAGLSVRGEWQSSLATTRTHGAAFVEVAVDIETGQVRPIKMVHVQDCGLPLNRLALESQINGGMIQSLGMALWEGAIRDHDLGVNLNPSFGDYKMPGTFEIPELVPIIDDEDPREAVVGIGEPSLIPSLAATINAVFNACGVRVKELPATPDKILMALLAQQEKRA